MTPKPTSPVTSTRAGDEMIQATSSASEKVCDHPSTEKAVASLVEFFKRSIREGPWDGCDLDGASVQDKAESLGLIIKTQYEPEIHGQQSDLEVGDDYFVFSPAISTALLIANPANSLRSLPESSDPSLLGRETVREETIEECAKIARSMALQMLAGMKLPADVRASDSQLSFGHKIADYIEADIRALASIASLKE